MLIVILVVFRRWRQEDFTFKDSLGQTIFYSVSKQKYTMTTKKSKGWRCSLLVECWSTRVRLSTPQNKKKKFYQRVQSKDFFSRFAKTEIQRRSRHTNFLFWNQYTTMINSLIRSELESPRVWLSCAVPTSHNCSTEYRLSPDYFIQLHHVLALLRQLCRQIAEDYCILTSN